MYPWLQKVNLASYSDLIPPFSLTIVFVHVSHFVPNVWVEGGWPPEGAPGPEPWRGGGDEAALVKVGARVRVGGGAGHVVVGLVRVLRMKGFQGGHRSRNYV